MIVLSPGKVSSEGAYDPNQELSLGTTVSSLEKRTRTSLFSVGKFLAYVALYVSGISLLMSARNLLLAR